MLASHDARAELTPLVRHDHLNPLSSVGFSTACFEGSDWSLAPLQTPEDPMRHPHLTSKLRNAMKHLGAENIFAPSPVQFNAQIVHPAELSRVLLLGNGVRMFRNPLRPADGTFLRHPGDAGIFSAGGCSKVVVSIDDQLLFAHAGRECVINRKAVLMESDARPFESVVDTITEEVRRLGYEERDLRSLHVWPLYSIRPEHFLHKFYLSKDDVPDEKKRLEHEQYNNRVAVYLAERDLGDAVRITSEGVEIDVTEVVRLQFLMYGVPEENIHLENRYLPEGLPTTRNGGGRYLVATVRH